MLTRLVVSVRDPALGNFLMKESEPKSTYTKEIHLMVVSYALMYKNPTRSRLQNFFCRMSRKALLFSHPAAGRDTPVLESAIRMNPPSTKYNAPKTQAAGGGMKTE